MWARRACRVNISAKNTTTEELIISGQMLLNQYVVVNTHYVVYVRIGFNSIKLLSSNTMAHTRNSRALCVYVAYTNSIGSARESLSRGLLALLLKGIKDTTAEKEGKSVMREGLHCLLENITRVVVVAAAAVFSPLRRI